MGFQWDSEKAAVNERKHGIAFADAVGVLEDIYALTLREEAHPPEMRYVTVGQDFLGRVVTVVFTIRSEDYRIISARKSTRRERDEYDRRI